MAARQQRFWPDPQPLVERLGLDFFRTLPERAGVYLMRDASDVVLYVGKAKSLRQRLTSYRVANPDRMPRRHLRLLRAVVSIQLEECVDERAALAREAELLRALKPRFNRAGTWPGTPRCLAWRTSGNAVELFVSPSPQPGWNCEGPLGTGAFYLGALLARLLWLALNRDRPLQDLPAGWGESRMAGLLRVGGTPVDGPIEARLESLFSGEVENFCAWVLACRSGTHCSPFEHAWFAAELESLREFLGHVSQRPDRIAAG